MAIWGASVDLADITDDFAVFKDGFHCDDRLTVFCPSLVYVGHVVAMARQSDLLLQDILLHTTSTTSCALDLMCPPSACREVWLQGHKRSPNQSAWTALLHLNIDLKMFGKNSEWSERVLFFNCLPIWRLQKDSWVEVLAATSY